MSISQNDSTPQDSTPPTYERICDDLLQTLIGVSYMAAMEARMGQKTWADALVDIKNTIERAQAEILSIGTGENATEKT